MEQLQDLAVTVKGGLPAPALTKRWLAVLQSTFRQERVKRWVRVEALCLCADLERRHGNIAGALIEASQATPEVKAEARTLANRYGLRSTAPAARPWATSRSYDHAGRRFRLS